MNSTLNNSVLAILIALSIPSLTGCGGDDDDTAGTAGTDSNGGSGGATSAASGGTTGSGGMSTSSGSGGKTGSAGTGASGSGGKSGSGGSTAPAPTVVTCGSAMCKGKGYFRACCVDESSSTCGVESAMLKVECAAPAVHDPNCADRPAAMGMTAMGCCASDHVCGVALSGSPCISLAGQDAGPLTPCGGDGGIDAGP